MCGKKKKKKNIIGKRDKKEYECKGEDSEKQKWERNKIIQELYSSWISERVNT